MPDEYRRREIRPRPDRIKSNPPRAGAGVVAAARRAVVTAERALGARQSRVARRASPRRSPRANRCYSGR